MNIIGITGPIGHGKSTFADTIGEPVPGSLHLESSAIISEVSDAFHAVMPEPAEGSNIEWMNRWLKHLPPILKDIVHVDCTYEDIEFTEQDVYERPIEYQKLFEHSQNLSTKPELARQQITPENKQEYRPILQWLGGYLVKQVNPSIWYDELLRRAQQAEHEGATLCVVGGVRFPSDAAILRKSGAQIIEIFRPNMPSTDSSDPTERERSQIIPDTKIVNNGDLADLRAVARKYLGDLDAGKPRPLYIATERA